MSNKIGIIGGSGVYNFDQIKVIKEINIDTPFGPHSSPILELSLDGINFYFLPRHGAGHKFLPSEINYRANIYALKSLGVKYCLSISAVGSLEDECAPETFVVPKQFLDWTKGKRDRTFFSDGVIGHVSVAYPVEKKLADMLYEACQAAKVKTKLGGTYICIEGPQFSTRAESLLYKNFGATVIGMTNVPEAFLAKEAGMAYATLAMVTDYDCWKEVHCTADEIMKVMKTNYLNAQKVIKVIIPNLAKDLFDFEEENKKGILTSLESMSAKQREIVQTLLK